MDKEKLLSMVQKEIDKLEKADKKLDKNTLLSFKGILLNTRSTQVFQKFLGISSSHQKRGSSLEEKYNTAIEFYRELSKYLDNYIDLARAFGYAARIIAGKGEDSSIKTNTKKSNKEVKRQARSLNLDKADLPDWKKQLLEKAN